MCNPIFTWLSDIDGKFLWQPVLIGTEYFAQRQYKTESGKLATQTFRDYNNENLTLGMNESWATYWCITRFQLCGIY